MKTWWVYPSNLALAMLAGFGFVLGLAVSPDRPAPLPIGHAER